jgi:hypothetical protein
MIAQFRTRFRDALEALFTRVLVTCAAAGMARLGTVTLDAAGEPQAFDCDRSREATAQQVREFLAAAAEADAADDAAFGGGVRRDRLPAMLRRRAQRRAQLGAAKAWVEAREAAEAETPRERLAGRAGTADATQKTPRARRPKTPVALPAGKSELKKADTADLAPRPVPVPAALGHDGWAATNDQAGSLGGDAARRGDGLARLHPAFAAARVWPVEWYREETTVNGPAPAREKYVRWL